MDQDLNAYSKTRNHRKRVEKNEKKKNINYLKDALS